MKTDLVDVNDTRKEPARRDSERRGRRARSTRVARDYSRRARLPGFRPGQGAGARHQAAIQGADSPRRRARPDPARRGRCAARARRRGRRHAGHPRRERRGGPGADVHGVVRHGAVVRSWRLLRPSPCGGRRAASTTRRSIRRCSGCASARRATSRSKAAAWSTTHDRPSSLRLCERRSGDPGTTPSVAQGRHAVELGRQGQPARVRRAAARARGRRRPRASPCTIRPTTRLGSWRTRTSRIP